MSHRRDVDKLVDEFRARQENIVFPDTVRNGRSVDLFLWKGSPNPWLVQRIAAWMFGLVYICAGLEILYQAVRERIESGFSFGVVFLAAMSLAAVLVGIRVFRNGFPRRANPAPE
jgi:hypothetical protein